MKPYSIAPKARVDLDAVWNFIAHRADPEIATNFVEKFDDIFTSIAASPGAGVRMPSLPPGDIRKFPMGNYLIYYRSVRGSVVIVRVLNGKRDQRKAFREKP